MVSENWLHEKLIRLERATYEGATTRVKSVYGEADKSEVKLGYTKDQPLDPCLVIIVIDVLSKEHRKRPLWDDLVIADDLVLTAKIEQELQTQVKVWQKSLERRGLKMNARKTVVMMSEGGEKKKVKITDVNGKSLKQVKYLRYLGSTIQSEGESEKVMRDRIKVGWRKWKEVAIVICDKRLPRALKDKVYMIL
ncbi:uncharacterized protein LOC106460140 [Limulus polyphemus]|uniref:Uncharacterized protein LOC106460140 n=1 Tax=Limulus polyphemus TaxID=6850 RepID=A0ABM1B5K4_LIMPO|nr:uncharacterized protein LOC106460140 [Limulus polyphemus]